MADPDPPDPYAASREIRIQGLFDRAREETAKLDHYFTGLIFTVLGLGLQTAKWDTPTRDAVQLTAFLLLLLAGTIALIRLELRPKSLGLEAEALQGISALQDPNENRSIERNRVNAERYTTTQRKLQKKLYLSKRGYFWQRALFIVACFLLIVS